MFSGGRDSTLAAVRLARQFPALVLVTVTSGHLVGIERVKRRLHELSGHLPANTEWIHVAQPPTLASQTLVPTTCLPCHSAYVIAGVFLARQLAVSDIAFGYVNYQSAWPEQTPYATERLRDLLNTIGMQLHLPVYSVTSKDDAVAELAALHLSTDALEQKCTQQEAHIALQTTVLSEEIDRWEQTTRLDLRDTTTPEVLILSQKTIGSFQKDQYAPE